MGDSSKMGESDGMKESRWAIVEVWLLKWRSEDMNHMGDNWGRCRPTTEIAVEVSLRGGIIIRR